MISRRGFFGAIIGAVAAPAAAKALPAPKFKYTSVQVPLSPLDTLNLVSRSYLHGNNLLIDNIFKQDPLMCRLKENSEIKHIGYDEDAILQEVMYDDPS